MQYPLYHELSQPYHFTVVSLSLKERKFISGINVSVRANSIDQNLFIGTTNENGWCGVSLTIPSLDVNTLIVLAENEATGEIVSTQFGLRVYTRTEIKAEQMHLFLIIDKKLYKPGELARYIGLCWADFDGCYYPITSANKSQSFSIKLIKEFKGVLFEKFVEPSEDGIIWGEFPIVENLQEGQYDLRLESKKVWSFQTARFEVKQYKRPEIEAMISFDSIWIVKTEAEEGYEYPMVVNYYYGDAVKSAKALLQLNKLSFYDRKHCKGIQINFPEALQLCEALTDESGKAIFKIKSTREWIETTIRLKGQNEFKNVELAALDECLNNGDAILLDTMYKVQDAQKRAIEKFQTIKCVGNVLVLQEEKIIFDIENGEARFQAKLIDQYEKGYSGPIQLKIWDDYNTINPISETIMLQNGKIERILTPRTVFGLAPKISLKGNVIYDYNGKAITIDFYAYYGRREEETGVFELLSPERIETGKSLSFELVSKSYTGPVWINYGKNETFSHISGIIAPNIPLKHVISIPKAFVGDISCKINYFNFQTMNVVTIDKAVSISLEQHLLQYNVELPLRAQPGEKISAKIKRTKKVIEPWLLAVKLVDKSLRGLSAVTEFDLNSIYSLTQALTLSTEQTWTKEIKIIVNDLETAIHSALINSKYEPNVYIVLFQLNNVLEASYSDFEWKIRPKSLMSIYFDKLLLDKARMLSFFKSLTPENLQLAVASFGSFFFPEYRLNFPEYEEIYFEIRKESENSKTQLSPLIHYFNDTFSEKLKKQTTEKNLNFLIQSMDTNIKDTLERYNQLLEIVKAESHSEKLTEQIENELNLIAKKSFAKRLFLEKHGWRYGETEKFFQLFNSDVSALKNLELTTDKEILEKIIDNFKNVIEGSSIKYYFKEDVELEKDEVNWGALNNLVDFIKSVKQANLQEKIKEITKFVFSTGFYKAIYKGFYGNYNDIEQDLKKLQKRENEVQKVALVELILNEINKDLFRTVRKENITMLISEIIYRKFRTNRILSLLDTMALPEELKSLKNQILLKMETNNYFREMVQSYLKNYSLPQLIKEISPTEYSNQLSKWRNRAYGLESFDFSTIGYFKEPVELQPKEMFKNAFGVNLSEIRDIFCEELGKIFLFLIKKGSFLDYTQMISYIEMLEIFKNVESYFYDLYSITTKHPGEYNGLREQVEIIFKENLFNVFYFYFLTELKAASKVVPRDFHQFSQVLDVFQTINPEAKFDFVRSERSFQKRFTYENKISLFSSEIRAQFLYVLAVDFVIKKSYREIPPKQGSTFLNDYKYFVNLMKRSVEIISTTPEGIPIDENVKSQINMCMNSFEEFWRLFSSAKIFVYPQYIIDSIVEINEKHGEIELALYRAIYKMFLNSLKEYIEQNPLICLPWIPKPKETKNYKTYTETIIRNFKTNPLSDLVREWIDALEYGFIVAEEAVDKYYNDILAKFSAKDMVFITINTDLVWFGKKQLSCFPTLIGYPKYTSIMTDVEGGELSLTPKKQGTTGGEPEKKVTIRKMFADIGHYEIIPNFDKESIDVPIKLPDSVTTQELHVAAFNKHCNMNYKISDIKVLQEFFIKEDLPDQLNWKDEIEANLILTNASLKTLDVKISVDQFLEDAPKNPLKDKAVEFSFSSAPVLTLKPKEINNILLTLKALKCGSFLVKIVADSKDYRDEVHKVVRVKAPFPSDINQRFEILQLSGKAKTIEKSFELPISSGVIDFQYFLSIYPSLTSHIIDGIEANLRYPYGCIEQTFSALIPNLVYYDYLASRNALKKEIREKLEWNIIGGYLKLQGCQKYNGSFGWWMDQEGSTFLTAMVLQAYRLLYKNKFLLETYSLRLIANYLLNTAMDKKDYTFHLPKSVYQERAISRFTDLTLTAHCCLELLKLRPFNVLETNQEFLFKKLLETVKNANFKDITDCYTLYLLYEIFIEVSPEEALKIAEQIKKYRINPQWLQGSAIGTDVETTARITQSLWKNKTISESVFNEILEWIYKQKEPYGGWRSTSDTRAVVELLTSILETEACDLNLSLECNGAKIISDKRISLENLSHSSYELQYIPLNKYMKLSDAQAQNRVKISLTGTGSPSIKLVQENWIEKKAEPLKGLFISRTCDTTRIKKYTNFDVTLNLIVPEELDEMIIVEEPLLPAAMIEQSSLDELIKNGSIIGFKNVGRDIAFFVPSGKKERVIHFTYIPTRRFVGFQSPPCIYPMYAPHKKRFGNVTKFIFL